MDPDDEFKVELWRAFFLGVRVSRLANELKLTNGLLKESHDKLQAVADGEETLYDPREDADIFYGEHNTERINAVFRSDRERAQLIMDGLEIVRDAE